MLCVPVGQVCMHVCGSPNSVCGSVLTAWVFKHAYMLPICMLVCLSVCSGPVSVNPRRSTHVVRMPVPGRWQVWSVCLQELASLPGWEVGAGIGLGAGPCQE